MNRPPNPYRDEHRRLTSEGNAAAGRGDYVESQRLWKEAARLKAQGIQETLRDEQVKAEVAARIREFLAVSDDMPDDEPMWMASGICLSWGDLRVLADYPTQAAGGERHA